ncbi:MAG: hypothetical protein ING10_11015 [Roseomonas sp.]|nr:hypothetical protein [Roseomonas sp.]
MPPVVAILGETHSELFKGAIFRPESVRVEEAVPGMRPDIIATLGQKELFIEVAVRHKVGAEKLALIKERRHSTIEIDLAKWRHETDEAKLALAIIHDAPRVWLFNNTSFKKEADWLAKQEERARQRRKHAIELANAILRSLSEPPLMEAPPGSLFAEYVAYVEDAGMADVVGVAIPGSGAFGVAEEIWQAAVLHFLLLQPAVTVRYMPLDNEDYSLLSAAATLAHRDAAVDWTVVEQITDGEVRDPRAAICEYLNYLVGRGIAEFGGADQYKISWDAMFRAREAQRERRARRDRHTALLKAFAEVSEKVGAPAMTFAAWMDMRHEGFEATPRELADRSEWSLSPLLDRMMRIGNLVTPNAAIVEGGLLGFPVEEHLAARKTDADRRRIEAEELKAARIKVEQARQAKEAADWLRWFRAESQEIEGGNALLHAPLKELGGRSIEQTQGWMSPTEAMNVRSMIREQQANARKKREQQAAAEEKAEEWRAKLIQRVAELFKPEFRHSVLRSSYPETFKRKLIDYCSDEQTYKISVKVAERVKVGRN